MSAPKNLYNCLYSLRVLLGDEITICATKVFAHYSLDILLICTFEIIKVSIVFPLCDSIVIALSGAFTIAINFIFTFLSTLN